MGEPGAERHPDIKKSGAQAPDSKIARHGRRDTRQQVNTRESRHFKISQTG